MTGIVGMNSSGKSSLAKILIHEMARGDSSSHVMTKVKIIRF